MAKQFVECTAWGSFSDFPVQNKALEKAREDMVQAIRAKYGENAPVSFERRSYGQPKAPVLVASRNEAPAISPELMQQFAAFIAMQNKAKPSKVKRAK